ncbi:MAG: class IV adenylate cyclase [Spirochaetia bacterium]|nr:class IV adenylate cyclase [Spirochaetia bacterium]
MAFEVELKAHIPSILSMKKTIQKRLGLTEANPYKKEDMYFSKPENLKKTDFRLRISGTSFIVTKKKKSQNEGIEVNDEIEFFISDAAEFIRFSLESGYVISIKKTKIGFSYTYNTMTIELSEVNSLGSFIELEILLDTSEAVHIAAAKKKLLDTLDLLGIDREAVEPRYYSEMLRTIDA